MKQTLHPAEQQGGSGLHVLLPLQQVGNLMPEMNHIKGECCPSGCPLHPYFPAVLHQQKVPQTITVVSIISANQSQSGDPMMFLSEKMFFLRLLNSKLIKQFE